MRNRGNGEVDLWIEFHRSKPRASGGWDLGTLGEKISTSPLRSLRFPLPFADFRFSDFDFLASSIYGA